MSGGSWVPNARGEFSDVLNGERVSKREKNTKFVHIYVLIFLLVFIVFAAEKYLSGCR